MKLKVILNYFCNLISLSSTLRRLFDKIMLNTVLKHVWFRPHPLLVSSQIQIDFFVSSTLICVNVKLQKSAWVIAMYDVICPLRQHPKRICFRSPFTGEHTFLLNLFWSIQHGGIILSAHCPLLFCLYCLFLSVNLGRGRGDGGFYQRSFDDVEGGFGRGGREMHRSQSWEERYVYSVSPGMAL